MQTVVVVVVNINTVPRAYVSPPHNVNVIIKHTYDDDDTNAV